MKYFLGLFIAYISVFSFAGTAYSQETETIKGTVTAISEDGTYIELDEKQISTTKEFLEDSYLSVGDVIELKVEKTDNGLKAIDFDYFFEEISNTEEIPLPTDESLEIKSE